jgi:pyruvate decarboxylase/indolepyruvate decarboxylase
VYFNAVIPALIQALKGYRHEEKIHNPIVEKASVPKDSPITQAWFWNHMTHYFASKDIILAETGTSMFGMLDTMIPDDATVITQPLWGSIGYSVGAVLGAALANPKRRTILFVGDGSFQLTAQEMSTVMRHKLTPIVFLLNNDGYTVERLIHGPNMPYNDIQPWHYEHLPAVFGEGAFTAQVKTEEELVEALKQTDKHRDQLCFIEVMMGKMDSPESLILLSKDCAAKNKGQT